MGVGSANGQGFGGVFLTETNFWFLWTPSNPLADAAVRSLGITFPSNQWLHFAVAMNYTNQVPAMYVNGQLVSTVVSNFIAQPLVTWVPSSQYHAGLSDSIGGRFINSPLFFNGELDEVDVYSRALNSAEIAALFAAGSAGKCNGPRLQIDKLPGAVRLTWTTNAAGYRLETNSPLMLPAGWGVLASNYSVIATNYAVTNAVGAGSRFYRLFKP